jgi:hypothetical protein
LSRSDIEKHLNLWTFKEQALLGMKKRAGGKTATFNGWSTHLSRSTILATFRFVRKSQFGMNFAFFVSFGQMVENPFWFGVAIESFLLKNDSGMKLIDQWLGGYFIGFSR